MDTSNIITELSKPLDIKDVDFRIQSINNGGYATILAYKNARVDMNRLDTVCGTNWQKKYHYVESKGLLFCSVGIKINEDWIWREDLGTESFSDKEKGQASDAFKRACFNWGIGRELYDYPTIQVKLNPNEFKVDNGKIKQTYELKLKDWNWDISFNEDGSIKFLKAFDERGNTRFDFPNKNTTTQPSSQETQNAPTGTQQSNSGSAEKAWLNVMDSQKNFTSQWLNVTKGINEGKVKHVDDVKKYFKVSKEVESKINELLNYQPA